MTDAERAGAQPPGTGDDEPNTKKSDYGVSIGDHSFKHDPRALPIDFAPALVEYKSDDGTDRTSYADVEVHDSGALHCEQFDGREVLLPSWRWVRVRRIPTITLYPHYDVVRAVDLDSWGLLPAAILEVVDRPTEYSDDLKKSEF